MTLRLGNSATNATGISARLMRRQKPGARPNVPKQLPVRPTTPVPPAPKPPSPKSVVEVADALPPKVVIRQPEPTPLPTPAPVSKPASKPKLTLKEVKAMKQSKKATKLKVSVPDTKITFSQED